MRALIVSDTHGRHENLELAIERERPFDLMIHLGDAEGYELYIERLAGCPFEMVAGNNDSLSDMPYEKEIKVADTRLLLAHGHTYYVVLGLERLWQEGVRRGVDAVLFGHIHQPLMRKRGEMLLLNPGSLSYPRQKGRRPSYMVMEAAIGQKAKFELRYL